MTSYSRRTLLNASPNIEMIVRNDLAAVIANAVDQQAMLGDGSSNKPTGVVHSGATNTGMTTATWGDILNFSGAVDFDNALDGTLGWAMAPPVRTKLMSTLVAASTDSRMIMSAPDSLVGYPAVTTTALPGSLSNETPVGGTLIFGDWSELLIASWTGVDLLINPYETTAYAKGRVLVRALKDLDVAVRHPESFAFSNNVTT
jgi:HK97 family phage major capsid protein